MGIVLNVISKFFLSDGQGAVRQGILYADRFLLLGEMKKIIPVIICTGRYFACSKIHQHEASKFSFYFLGVRISGS